jgi:TatD DNase family protein
MVTCLFHHRSFLSVNNMQWIDTHCHLDAPELAATVDKDYQNALAAGVNTLIIPAVTTKTFAGTKHICTYPGCYPAYGLHPIYQHQPEDLQTVKDWLTQEPAIAVGEIGLDGFVPGLDMQQQIDFYYAQLRLARDFDLPVILHIRKAQDAILKGLRRFRPKAGIAHAFNGSMQQAKAFIDLGCKLGFGGAMTYSRALNIRRLATELPLESIVLETDSPDIRPAFAPDVPNVPANIPLIAQTLAELRQVSLEDVANQTTTNAREVFFPV